jgi:hypothetical protein
MTEGRRRLVLVAGCLVLGGGVGLLLLVRGNRADLNSGVPASPPPTAAAPTAVPTRDATDATRSILTDADTALVAAVGGSPSAEMTVDSRFADTVETPAGVVSVVEVEPPAQVVKLGGETIYPPTCPRGGPHCAKIKAVRDNDHQGGVTIVNRVQVPATHQAVLVMQEVMMGNACNGTSFWFTSFSADGSHLFSEPIDYCGGPDLRVYVRDKRIHVSVPATPPNRGTGIIPGFDYAYDPATARLAKVR